MHECNVALTATGLPHGPAHYTLASAPAATPPLLPPTPQSLHLSIFTGACGTHVTHVAALLTPEAARKLRSLWVRAPQIQEPALVAIGRLTNLEVRLETGERGGGPKLWATYEISR